MSPGAGAGSGIDGGTRSRGDSALSCDREARFLHFRALEPELKEIDDEKRVKSLPAA
jgi:hypothetical protein